MSMSEEKILRNALAIVRRSCRVLTAIVAALLIGVLAINVASIALAIAGKMTPYSDMLIPYILLHTVTAAGGFLLILIVLIDISRNNAAFNTKHSVILVVAGSLFLASLVVDLFMPIPSSTGVISEPLSISITIGNIDGQERSIIHLSSLAPVFICYLSAAFVRYGSLVEETVNETV